MYEFITMIKLCIAGLGGLLSFIYGSLDEFMVVLIIFVVMDYLTGVIKSIYNKRLNSYVGYKGIIRKICIFLVVALANLVDVYIIKSGSVLRDSIIFFYLGNESISILENFGKMGVPIPKKLQVVLEQLKKEGEVNE